MGGGIRAFCPKCGHRLKGGLCFKCGWVYGKETQGQKELFSDTPKSNGGDNENKTS